MRYQPTKLLLKVMESGIWNLWGPVYPWSLSNGCVPEYFMTTCENPLLKKTKLQPNFQATFFSSPKIKNTYKYCVQAALLCAGT